MSLLMKALEKAAKDRDEGRTEPAAATPAAEPASEAVSYSPSAPASTGTVGARSELSLEPIPIPAEPSISPAPARTEPPSSRPAAPTRAGRAATAAREERAKAATVVQAAGSTSGGGAVAWLLARPVWIIGILAALTGIVYGTYVYLQLFHPALFLPSPPIAPKAPPPLASPISQAPAPAAGTIPGPGTAATTADATPGVGSTAPAQPAAPALPAPVIQTAVPDVAPASPPAVAAAPPRAPEKPAAEAPPPPAPRPAPRDTIVVSRGSAVVAVNPLLTTAYAALQADRREDAQRAYEQILRTEPRNIDALLGLAAIAVTDGKSEEATRRYVQILELDPRNTLAQSGLIALLGRADPVAAEARLKQLIARDPSAYLYFTLGNLYADQAKWALAQQAYFQAHSLEPNNPDYTYNLAVGLEHVSQTRLALGFYRRAVELAGTSGLARFDVAQAQQRISKLASQVE